MKTKIITVAYPVRDVVIEQLTVTVADNMTDEQITKCFETYGRDYEDDIIQVEDSEIIDREYSGEPIPMEDGSPCLSVYEIESEEEDELE